MLQTSAFKAALLLKIKETGRRVAADPNSSTDRYLVQYGFQSTDPTRAISKLHSLLVEGDLRQLWQETKQRMKAQLHDACSVYQRGSKPAKQRTSQITAAELEPLYGSDGVMRVSGGYCQGSSG